PAGRAHIIRLLAVALPSGLCSDSRQLVDSSIWTTSGPQPAGRTSRIAYAPQPRTAAYSSHDAVARTDSCNASTDLRPSTTRISRTRLPGRTGLCGCSPCQFGDLREGSRAIATPPPEGVPMTTVHSGLIDALVAALKGVPGASAQRWSPRRWRR